MSVMGNTSFCGLNSWNFDLKFLNLGYKDLHLVFGGFYICAMKVKNEKRENEKLTMGA